MLGFRHTVKGLDGHDIVLSRTGVTQPGQLSSLSLTVFPHGKYLALTPARLVTGFVDVVSGEGMPIYHLTGHGNLFVEYQVVMPPSLTPKQREGMPSVSLNGSTT